MHQTLDLYATDAPNRQATVDIFSGTWSTQLPGGLVTGPSGNFYDSRVELVEREFGFAGKSVLELGPMEAGHTFGIHALGAKSIVAVEGNSNCYLKCLMVKELYDLNRASILYGDIIKHLENTKVEYDVIFASGVLYHMMEPLKLLSEIKRHTQKAYIWTGFYDREVMEPAYGERFKDRFKAPIEIKHGNFTCTGYPQSYEEMLDLPQYSGGSAPGSVWLSKDDILRFLKHIGFNRVEAMDIDYSYGFAPRASFIAEV